MPTTTLEGPRPGRPRSEAADEAIQEATLELLARDGYGHLTMSGVAAEAGVSTATLYRRWGSKLELVIATFVARAGERTLPDKGSLREDITALLREVVEQLTTTASGRIVRGLIDEIGRNPELADAIRENLIVPRRAALAAMLERATARGELRPGLDHAVVLDLVFGPLYHRLLVTGEPVTPRVLRQLTDLVLHAIGTGATAPTRTSPTHPARKRT
jgi:AcrR family transcriptional regulator